MQYYSAKVRLSGSTMNEVEKVLSAPEILVLQYIHGVDAILNVKYHEKKQISLRDEKERLKGLYDTALVKREQSINTIFGPLGSVPEQLPSDLAEQFGLNDDEDTIAVLKASTQADKRANHSQTMTPFEQERLERVIPAEMVSLQDMAD